MYVIGGLEYIQEGDDMRMMGFLENIDFREEVLLKFALEVDMLDSLDSDQ